MTTYSLQHSESHAPATSKAARVAKPYAHPYIAAVALGIVLFLAFFITGNGIGASGGMARLSVFVEDLIAPEHVDSVPYLSAMAGGDKNPLENWVVFVVGGAVLGGFASGLISGRLKFETVRGPRITVQQRWVLAFVGGAIMGFGARLARGCTSGQALSGGATLSVGSWLFMIAVFAGAYGVAYFVRKLWN